MWWKHEGGRGMDASRFDRLSKMVAGANSRRGLLQATAALAIAGIPALEGDDAGAKQRGKRQGIGAETFHHKKRYYCLNGETIRRYRRKQDKLLAMGATIGKCGIAPCVPVTCADLGFICGPADDDCGGTLECGTCQNVEAVYCSGQCALLDQDDNNCGTCGNVCVAPSQCFGGRCQIP